MVYGRVHLMHVLQLLPKMAVGGVERGVLDLAKGMVARGHRVSVASSGGPLVERLTAVGAMHYRLPLHQKSLTSAASCVPVLAQLIRETQVDVVHARSRVPAWIGWAASRRAQRPFVTTAHGFYTPHPASRVMVWGRLVIVPSEALACYLIEHFRVSKRRLRIIPRGVDLAEFARQPACAPGDRPMRIGLFGRLSPIKGHAVALRALARLRQEGLRVTLCIAGDVESPLRDSLVSLAASLKLQDAVEWLGLRPDVASLIGSVDVVVVPSTYPESFGRGVIEAQAVGRPVVASRAGALAELIDDGKTGLLVPPQDPYALADAIARLIRDPALRERCVAAASRQVERLHSVDAMVERTLAVYDECVTKPRILIWKLGALGDVILATPSLRALRRHVPKGHLALAVGRAAYEAVARCPYLDDILIYEAKGKDRGWRRQLAWVRRLRAEGFDWSIDLQNSRATHLLAWLAGIPVRVGYRRKYGWLLNRGVRLPRVVLAPIAHQHYLLRQAGLWSPPGTPEAPRRPLDGGRHPAPPEESETRAAGSTDGEHLELWPSEDDAESSRRLLPEAAAGQATVGLHPGGSGRWRTKRWDLQRWVALCEALQHRGIRVVITGGPDERDLGGAFLQSAGVKPVVLIGRTNLMELACLIKRCDVFVAHDSSPLHVASAVGTPAVALFGPTDPARHLPPNFAGRVIKRDVFCSPCYSSRCRTVTHACMKRIGVDDVLQAVLDLLAAKPAMTGRPPMRRNRVKP